MLKVKIVLVRPVYDENVGLTARTMANFGYRELALVGPECDWNSGKAKSRAMHGKSLLLKAKEFDSIKEAVKDCSYAIATSARKGKNRNFLKPVEIAERFGKSNAKIALVFGSEPSGLSNREIAECDFVASIPASAKYPTLNLSHAVCVMLYQLFAESEKKAGNGKKAGFKSAKPTTKKILVKIFEKDLSLLSSIDDKKAVLASFKALCSRSLLSEKEAKALIAFLSETEKSLNKKGF